MTQERGRRQQAVPADAIPSCPSEMPEPVSSRRDVAVRRVNRHRAGYVARRALPPCAVADLQRAQRLDDEPVPGLHRLPAALARPQMQRWTVVRLPQVAWLWACHLDAPQTAETHQQQPGEHAGIGPRQRVRPPDE